MTPQEAHRKIADVMDMCEGTNVKWFECFRLKYTCDSIEASLVHETAEAAIAIVEDKPVFVGNVFYTPQGERVVATSGMLSALGFKFSQCSWLPPKHKTVMVELTVEDAKRYVQRIEGIRDLCEVEGVSGVISDACREALAKLER